LRSIYECNGQKVPILWQCGDNPWKITQIDTGSAEKSRTTGRTRPGLIPMLQVIHSTQDPPDVETPSQNRLRAILQAVETGARAAACPRRFVWQTLMA